MSSNTCGCKRRLSRWPGSGIHSSQAKFRRESPSPSRADDPRIVEETRQYIRDFDRIAETTKTRRELYDQILAIYPERINPDALWNSARALKG